MIISIGFTIKVVATILIIGVLLYGLYKTIKECEVRWRLEIKNRRPKVYLAGPIAECTDPEAFVWRRKTKEALLSTFDFEDPMDRDFREGSLNRPVLKPGDEVNTV